MSTDHTPSSARASSLSRAWRWLAPTRAFRAAHLIFASLGAACCFVPMLNRLGYESAVFFGVTAGVAASALTLHSLHGHRLGEGSTLARFFDLSIRLLSLLALPIVLISLNAVRVPNCAWGVGAGFWVAIPVVSVLVGQTLAWAGTALAPASTRIRVLLVGGALLGSIVWALAELALQPPIVGHQLLVGYFSGSIYDEALSVPMSLVWYRLMVVAGLVSLVAAVEAKVAREAAPRRARALAVVLVAGMAWASLYWHRQDLGIARDAAYIQRELGGRLETEHFIIYYPATRSFHDRRELLADDHEFRYAQLASFFEAADGIGDEKWVSYIYPDRETKADLMGGRRTQVAKLWLREMHLTWPRYGDHMLAHEMAHLFTEPFGAGPLSLSMTPWLGVNMGLVEGIATAADWPPGELTPHQASAALIEMDAAPPITAIVGATGFWAQASGRAYTLVGSFVRYLIDTYGIDRFKRAYPRGDFEAAYGRSAEALVEEWRGYLASVELSERERRLARTLYDRPSIFEKVCPRRLAELRRRARRSAGGGQIERARQLYEQVVGFSPGNPAYREEYARALEAAGALEDALRVASGLSEEARTAGAQANAHHLVGDLRWRMGNHEEAAKAYRDSLEAGLPTSTARLVELKAQVLERDEGEARGLAEAYLLDTSRPATSLYLPIEWASSRAEDPLAHYLIGRRLWADRRWHRALAHLEIAERALGPGLLRAEARRMSGQAAFFLEDYARAAAIFEGLEANAFGRYNTEATEWLSRVRWKQGNTDD